LPEKAYAPSQGALLHHHGPKATWGNLGLWDSARHYADACTALARAVGRAAEIQPGDAVLSVACGAGDELLMWRREFAAGSIVAIEADPSAAEHARRLTAQDSAIEILTRSAPAPEPLAAERFERVVCVDAAYHLSPRKRFLHQAFACLRPGGRLALTDLLLPVGGAGPGFDTAARRCGIDPADLVSCGEYVARLKEAGFGKPHVESLDARVLAGFATFVARQSRVIGWSTLGHAWRRPLLTALLIRACGRRMPGYALITADKARG